MNGFKQTFCAAKTACVSSAGCTNATLKTAFEAQRNASKTCWEQASATKQAAAASVSQCSGLNLTAVFEKRGKHGKEGKEHKEGDKEQGAKLGGARPAVNGEQHGNEEHDKEEHGDSEHDKKDDHFGGHHFDMCEMIENPHKCGEKGGENKAKGEENNGKGEEH
jgi:hypothetical protein